MQAFCLGAAKQLEKKLLTGTDTAHRTNALVDLVLSFGKPSKKDLVTGYAQTMADLELKYTRGIGFGILDTLNGNVLKGRAVVASGTEQGADEGSKHSVVSFVPARVGLLSTPGYFRTMQLRLSDYIAAQAAHMEEETTCNP